MIGQCQGCQEKQEIIERLTDDNESKRQMIAQLLADNKELRAESERLRRQASGVRDCKEPSSGDGDSGSAIGDSSNSVKGGSQISEGEEREQCSGSEGQQDKPRRGGHGRTAAESYRAEQTVICNHESLKAGERCPRAGCPGRLYDTKQPCVHVQLLGRPAVTALRYDQQVLRCSACQQRFVAGLPPGVEPVKYDATADAMIALMKYGLGMPWYRLSRLQELMGVPLAESTQFERCEQVANAALPVYLELEKVVAEGAVVHTDDTGVKILSCMKENRGLGDNERKGMHTTGMGASGPMGAAGGNAVALYASGRRHAGENLARVLSKRPAELGPPIVMADAEAKNWTGDFEQIAAKCLQHGRRRFSEIELEFPAECQRVLCDLGAVYKNEAQTRGMTSGERLLYHQRESGPILTELRKWCQRQFDERLVEPNSNLGRAIRYLLRHWNGLTRFLEIEGVPLDNNFVERALKRAVLHRKNSMFYKTGYGAAVGDIVMSLIETCSLNKVNPFDYLTAVVRESSRVRNRPDQWLPWNYKDQQSRSRAAA